jgi:putative tryptophan/tyrosine transport system substrate-binding protein
MSDMLRRAFITLLGGAALCSFAARAEKGDGIRRVAIIMGFAENDEVWQSYLASFRQGLQELGWSDGRNIRFDYRFTGESEERMRAMAEEVVAFHPDVILVSTNSVVSATLKATRSIPIVFTWVSDPVGSGFVTNLPRPGGNIRLSQFRAGHRREMARFPQTDRTRPAPRRSCTCS